MTTTRLPIVGSTAATTTFARAALAGPGPATLYFDGNQKITAGNGTFATPAANAFSLLDRDTCPGKTPTCARSCYVQNLAAAQPDLHALYRANTVAIGKILGSVLLANAWADLVAEWVTMNARGGFRWHVSGDLFSRRYAEWVADVVHASPLVDHWIYTRSFDHAEALLEVTDAGVAGGNLRLNLSCDRDNLGAAREFRSRHGVGTLCYLVTDPDEEIPDLPAGSVIFPDYNLRPRACATLAESAWWQRLEPRQRAMVCPVDAHSKSETRRCGPCTRCLP